MITAPDYLTMISSLQDAFSSRYEDSPIGHVRLIGILFAPIGSPLAQTEIIPRLGDFHHRSGKNVDFFLAGYGACCPPPSYVPVPNALSDGWTYSSSAFSHFCDQLESYTNWNYKGGCELLLVNAKYKRSTSKVIVDFRTAIVCDLDKMKLDGAIDSVPRFFEDIFRYAKSCSGEDPAWGFSDKLASKSIRSALMLLVLSLFPKNIGKDVKNLQHFAVHNIGKEE